MRRPLVAGNWKMNKTTGEAVALTSGLITELAGFTAADALLCPPFTALAAVGETLRSRGSAIALGGQDLFIQDSGAFTGMVAPGMLTDLGCTYVIVGHSERRGRFGTIEDWMTPEVLALFGDSDATVNAKARKALSAGMTPIICFGETISERRDGQTDTVCEAQVRSALAGVDGATVGQLVLAYEPVWAIGTGETCDAPEANRVCGLARSVVASVAGPAAADAIRIQYGGSVKPDNAAELLGQEHIDGALVGGASLKVDSFTAIVRAAR